jgi:REP element-mobilizing transposase RayT
MPQSLSKVYVHIIFSTKNRKNLIDNRIEKTLYEYLGGICKGLDCNPVMVGGHKNHIHILCLLSRKVTQMKLLEEVKKQSSKWIKTKDHAYANFYWQDGYGIFSVNSTETDKVIDYIRLQAEHHKHKSFQDEFLDFLKKYQVPFDERYIWD